MTNTKGFQTTQTDNSLPLKGSVSGIITFSGGTAITDYTIVLPNVQGAAGTTLTNDGAGNLSWASGGFTGALGNNLYTETYLASMPLVGTFNLNDLDMTFTNPGAPTTATMNGLTVKESYGAAWVAGGGDYVAVLGNIVNNAGAFTFSSETGFKASVQSSGTSTITLARGYESLGSFTHVGNIVTNYEAYHVSAPFTGGTITNVYGLHVDNLNAGTNNYGVVVEGASTKAIWTKSGMVEFDNPTTVGVGTIQSSLFSTTISPAGDSLATYEGQEVVISQSTQHNISNPIIGQINVINSHPGGGNTDFKTVGFRSANQLIGAGTVTTAQGFISLISANTGAIGDAFHFYAQNLALAAGGSSGTQYGMFIENMTGAADNYGIWISGATTQAIVVETGSTVFGGVSSDASAIVDIQSTTQGFVTPRMTTAQRNAILPTEGLEVWDLDIHGKFVYDGTNWIQL